MLWAKHIYLWLQMGIYRSPKTFQVRIPDLMNRIDYVYLDDLKHLMCKDLRVNVTNSTVVTDNIKCLGYQLHHNSIYSLTK